MFIYFLRHLQATVGTFENAFKLANAVGKIDINGETLQVLKIKFASFMKVNKKLSIRRLALLNCRINSIL